METWREHARKIERALAALERSSVQPRFERVAARDFDVWTDHDLVALIENRLGIDADPNATGAAQRDAWAISATDDGRLYQPDVEYAQPYWLVSDGERVGTIALGRMPLGSTRCGVSSLYVRRDRRGRGIASAALDAVAAAMRREGLTGIRLETSWCWSSSVAFYARRGFWVGGWKRELALVACAELGHYEVRIAGDEARFSYASARGRLTTIIVAERRGDRLAWTELARPDGTERAALAAGTFAMHLALRGWPLVTSDAAWADQLHQGFSECGGPEGLAFRIREWEAVSKSRGWCSSAPRIPGLGDPGWRTLADRRALDA